MTESDIQKPKPEILWIGKYVQMCSLLTCIDGSSIDVPEGLRPIIEFSSRKQSDKKASSPNTIQNIEKGVFSVIYRIYITVY